MKKINIAFLIIASAIILSSNFSQLSAQKAASSTRAGVQRNAEKGLKDNRFFIYYINFTISNYGTEEEKKTFENIVRRDLMAQMFYLRFVFADAYKHIRIAQKDLIELYVKKISEEARRSKTLTDSFASLAINSGDARARLYLRLAYRELTFSRIEATMSDNYKPTLYSMRLHKYVRAMKHLKEAKRYAFLARIRLIMTENEKIKDKQFNFDEISSRIESFASKDEKSDFLLMHYDSYYRCPGEKTVFDSTWQNPKLEDFQPYSDFKKSEL